MANTQTTKSNKPAAAAKTGKQEPAPKAKQSLEDLTEFPFEYIGNRLKTFRMFAGETRDTMATRLGISTEQYGNLENKTSCTVKNLTAVINFFHEHYNLNPAWLLLSNNENLPMEINKKKDIGDAINELNALAKTKGLMVSLVPVTNQ
jgi:DNA-binding XRE family transcriptional regulator